MSDKKPKTKYIYKIKHLPTGLYAAKGWSLTSLPEFGDTRKYGWSKQGKVWTGTGPLKNALRQSRDPSKLPPTVVIEAIEMKPAWMAPVSSWLAEG